MSSKPKTAATTEVATSALVPKLRFPEFRGTEGWKQESLGSLGSFTRGLTYSSSDVAAKGLLVLRSTNIQDGGLVLDKDLVFVSKTCPDALRLKEGDIVVCMSNGSKALVGKSGEYFGGYFDDLTVGAFCSFYRPAFPFAKLAFQIGSYQQYVADLIAGGNINNLTNSVLEEFNFPVPQTVAEQQKIAECLSSVDELMAAQARKVDALKTHKRGLMQQLFPREGETQPRLRFPEFQNAGGWEKTTIGELGNFSYGKSAPKWSLEDDAPTPCVRYGELYTKFGPIITETYSRTNIDPSTLRFSKGGEILVPRVGEKPEDFGKCCCYLPLKGVAIGEMISVFETKQHPLFYTYYFRHLYRQFARVVEGQNVKNLYYAVLQPLAIYRPPLPEQECIASCLSSLDALITAETQKLEALKTHKKGLMQRLFPTPEEVEV